MTLDDPSLTEQQLTGLTDMDPDAFRAAGHEVVDMIARGDKYQYHATLGRGLPARSES